MNDAPVTLQKAAGYWRACWRDSAGKRRTKCIGNMSKVTKKQAQSQVQTIAAELINTPGAIDMHDTPTLSQWKNHYFTLRHDMAQATRIDHDLTFRLLIQQFGTGRRIDKISRVDAALFRSVLSQKPSGHSQRDGTPPTLSEATVRKHIRNAKTFFNYAHRMDMLKFNPFDREPSSPPRIDKSWAYITPVQLLAIVNACPDTRWQALVAMCRLAGLRRGEALRMKWTDLDWDQRRITVDHEGEQTTKHRRRVLPMQPLLHEILLRRYDMAVEGDVLVCPISHSNLTRQLQAIVKAAGLELYGKLYHTLRKNCETDWLQRYPIMDVCDWLGHDPTVAAKHYHQARPEIMDQVAGITENVHPGLTRQYICNYVGISGDEFDEAVREAGI